MQPKLELEEKRQRLLDNVVDPERGGKPEIQPVDETTLINPKTGNLWLKPVILANGMRIEENELIDILENRNGKLIVTNPTTHKRERIYGYLGCGIGAWHYDWALIQETETYLAARRADPARSKEKTQPVPTSRRVPRVDGLPVLPRLSLSNEAKGYICFTVVCTVLITGISSWCIYGRTDCITMKFTNEYGPLMLKNDSDTNQNGCYLEPYETSNFKAFTGKNFNCHFKFTNEIRLDISGSKVYVTGNMWADRNTKCHWTLYESNNTDLQEYPVIPGISSNVDVPILFENVFRKLFSGESNSDAGSSEFSPEIAEEYADFIQETDLQEYADFIQKGEQVVEEVLFGHHRSYLKSSDGKGNETKLLNNTEIIPFGAQRATLFGQAERAVRNYFQSAFEHVMSATR